MSASPQPNPNQLDPSEYETLRFFVNFALQKDSLVGFVYAASETGEGATVAHVAITSARTQLFSTISTMYPWWKEHMLLSWEQATEVAFACPETLNILAMAATQLGWLNQHIPSPATIIKCRNTLHYRYEQALMFNPQPLVQYVPQPPQAPQQPPSAPPQPQAPQPQPTPGTWLPSN